jgi:hypothetical protein
VVRTANFDAIKDEKMPTALEAKWDTSQSWNQVLIPPMTKPPEV